MATSNRDDQVKATLQSFQDGYAVRDFDLLDEFMVIGALKLYLDYINQFLLLLRASNR